MFRLFPIASVLLVIVVLKQTVSDQESFSYANCQLTNTCFGKTTDDLANGRSTTPKITDKQTTSNTQTTSTVSQSAAPLATNTRVSLHTADKPSTEDTCCSKSKQHSNTTPHTTIPISTAKQLNEATDRNSEAPEVTESSTIMETADAYTINSVSKFDTPLCLPASVVVIDFTYILCRDPWNEIKHIRAYDNSIPHDLLMIIMFDEMKWPVIMVGSENTNTLYVGDWQCECIWEIDTVRSIVSEWLTRLGGWFSLSVTNDNLIVVLNNVEDPQYLEIYDEDAKLVSRRVSLPNDFKGPSRAIQKPNGEFIVSYRSKNDNAMWISFLNFDGQIISQFRLKETVGFTDVQMFYDRNSSETFEPRFAAEMFGENVYMLDWSTYNWNLTDLSVIISNSSDDSSGKIVGFRSTDGRIISQIAEIQNWQVVDLFWHMDNKNLLLSEYIFRNLYIFNTKTLKGSQVGRKSYYMLHYDTKRQQFLFILDETVTILALNKY